MKKSFINNFKEILLSIVTLLFVLQITSCKKDLSENQNINIEETFFRLPDNADPSLIRIVNYLKYQNEKKPFVRAFVKNQGYPIWEHAKIKIPLPLKNGRITQTENIDGVDTIISIPTVLQSELYVKSILTIKLNTTVLFKLLEGDNWASYGFNHDPNRIELNADDIVTMFMKFEKEIFGTNIFQIKDNRLFDYWPSGQIKPNTFYIKNDTPPEDDDSGCDLWYETIEIHGEWYDTGVTWWEGEGCDLGGGGIVIYTNGNGNVGGGGWTTTEPTGGGGTTGPNGGSTSPNSGATVCDRGWLRIAPNPDNPNPQTPTPPTTPCPSVPAIISIEIVTNELTKPCQINAFNKVTSTRLKNALINMYTETFVGTSSTHNLTLNTVTDILDPNGNHIPGRSEASLVLPNTWIINLNGGLIGLTEELWGNVILHEMVHGFIRKNNLNFTPSSQFGNLHKIMLDSWIIKIKNALMESFQISEADALALSLEGFDDVLRDEVTNEFKVNMKAWMHIKYNVDLNAASQIADQYYQGIKGTPCQ